MSTTTNQLRAKAKQAIIPVVACSALAFGIASYSYHPVKAAPSSGVPMSDSSIAPLLALDHSVEAVAARVTPAVVNIAVTSKAPQQAEMEGAPLEQQQGNGQDGDAQGGDPMEQFRRFFQQGPGQGMQQQQQQIEHGIGSGIIISPDGYIVTNNHVVNGAMEIRVTLHDRRTYAAKLVGTDKLTDLAVVKINATDLPCLPWGNSSALKQGQTVLAFGSPFGYFRDSVTRGIVSAVNRSNPYSDDARKPGGYIQTDAAINPGNSGGPLVDAEGEVVGINTFLISDSGSFAGAGFAIPSQIAGPISAELIKSGKVSHGYLGIGIEDVTPDNAKFFDVRNSYGAVVTQVTPDSPGGHAGLRVGDVITAINGQKVDTASELQMTVSDNMPGKSVALEILRDGKPQSISATLGQYGGAHEVAAAAHEGENHARLGIAVADVTPDVRHQLNLPERVKGGVAVTQVRPGSPAEDAGLTSGDVILEVNRKPVDSSQQLRDDVEKVPSGQDVLLLVWSNGGASFRVVHTAPTAG
jgi:serine protease Do